MSRNLASSGQHLVDGKGSSGPSSGFSRILPLPTPQTKSLTWLRQCLKDRQISHRCDPERSPHSPDLNPPDFHLWEYLKGRVYGSSPLDYPLPKGNNHSNHKSDSEGGMQEGNRELCSPDPSLPAALGSSFGVHIFER